DGKGAPLGGDPAVGTLSLFVGGRGKHKLELDMVTHLETSASQQTLHIRLPRLSTASLHVEALGNVEVKSGASVIQRRVDTEAAVTHFDLATTADVMSIVLSLNNRQERQQRVVVSRGVLVSELTAAYERLHATMSM